MFFRRGIFHDMLALLTLSVLPVGLSRDYIAPSRGSERYAKTKQKEDLPIPTG